MNKILGSLFLGFFVSHQGIGLFHDAWTQEKYELSIRESGKLEMKIISFVDVFLLIKPILAVLMIVSGIFIMNRIRAASFFVSAVYIIHSLVYYNPVLYYSKYIGGQQVINGALWSMAIFFCIFSVMNENQEQQLSNSLNLQEQKELKKPIVTDNKEKKE